MIFNYVCGRTITKFNDVAIRKTILVIGIIGNVTLLGYFKYADFFIANTNVLLNKNIPLLHLMLPLAISFFTFQQIAYLVDTYRNDIKQYNFLTYSLFVTFFPQLIAGPIVSYKEMMSQYTSLENKSVRWDNISKGVFIFFIGLAKKVAIADTFSIWANDGYSDYMNLTSIEAWITSLSYTLQLYFDFSGYCDMAIGLALFFNIKLPINFDSPYKSRNIQEFWRRWHITLGRFLTHYIYIPLGGSRRGEFLTYTNIFIIFAISGFWHGAGWTFIIWGVLHGVASIICRMWGKLKIKMPYLVAWFLTFMFANAAWVYFRAESVQQAHVLLKKMAFIDLAEFKYLFMHRLQFATAKTFDYELFSLDNPKIVVVFLSIFLLMSFFMKNSIRLLEEFKPSPLHVAWVHLSLLFVLITVFFLHKNSEFLYFNF